MKLNKRKDSLENKETLNFLITITEMFKSTCVFHTKLDSQSTANWTVIPAQSGQ